MTGATTACYNSYSDRSEFFGKFGSDFGEDGDWCESSCWNNSPYEEKYLENYLLQNFNIQPVKYEKQQVKLPRMVPGTKNFVECDELDDFQSFTSTLISQNLHNTVSFFFHKIVPSE